MSVVPMFVLASSSPRRQQMLRDLGVKFEIISPDADETVLKRELPKPYVMRLAKEKARSARVKAESQGRMPDSDWYVLAADTIVVSGNKILGKPTDKNEAVRMGKKLSGKKHKVLTAFCWIGNVSGKEKQYAACVSTTVKFSKRPDTFWRWYSETGEPLDKAGAYAAQGIGVSFIESIEGSYSNVVGLPLAQALDAFLKTFGKPAFQKIFPWV